MAAALVAAVAASKLPSSATCHAMIPAAHTATHGTTHEDVGACVGMRWHSPKCAALQRRFAVGLQPQQRRLCVNVQVPAGPAGTGAAAATHSTWPAGGQCGVVATQVATTAMPWMVAYATKYRVTRAARLHLAATPLLLTADACTAVTQGVSYYNMVKLIDFAYDVPLSYQEGLGSAGGYTLVRPAAQVHSSTVLPARLCLAANCACQQAARLPCQHVNAVHRCR